MTPEEQKMYDEEYLRLNNGEYNSIRMANRIVDMRKRIKELEEQLAGKEMPLNIHWTKEKPNYPCVFVGRITSKVFDRIQYGLEQFKFVDSLEDDSRYLGWFNMEGEEIGDYDADCNFDEYLIIENLEGK